METVGCLETSARNYHHVLRNIPEECSFLILRVGSLKSDKRILLPNKWGLLFFLKVTTFIPGYAKTQCRELLTTLKTSNV